MSLPVVGQTVHIRKQGAVDQGHARVLEKTIDGIYLDVPLIIGQGAWLAIEDADDVRISYVFTDGALYHFDTVVLKHAQLDGLSALLIQMPTVSDITRVQRRSFVRMEMSLQIAILRTQTEQQPSLRTGTGMTYDMSGGGLSFIPQKDMEIVAGDQVTVKFSLPHDGPDERPISAKGTIVRQRQDERGRIIFSMRFETISAPEQQRIVQYVFKRQIELRSKGLF